MIRSPLLVIALSLVMCSCTGSAPAAPAAEPPPGAGPVTHDEPTPTEATADEPPPEIEDVVIPGAEGLSLSGAFLPSPSSPAPGVLLLHMYAGSKADWAAFQHSLQSGGIASLAIDLRGHGATRGTEDWGLSQEDVALAYAWLAARQEIIGDRVGIVGASIGANLALVEGASEPSVRALVLLSPGQDYFRVRIDGLIELYGDRPSLLVASEEDQYSAETVRTLAALAPDAAELVMLANAGHGTAMLGRDPGLGERLLEFLTLHLMIDG
jgi:pimeloyl-ACP methyl ester carboxylesterase